MKSWISAPEACSAKPGPEVISTSGSKLFALNMAAKNSGADALVIDTPAPREAVEPPIVKRAIEALGLLRFPIAPVVIRARAAYQTVMESGRSVVELPADTTAAQEMRELCAFVDRIVFEATPKAASAAQAVASSHALGAAGFASAGD